MTLNLKPCAHPRTEGILLMPNNPKANEEKMRQMLNAWETLAQDKTFGGMTFGQFHAATNRPLNARAVIDDLQDQLDAAINVRDDEDDTWLPISQMVVAGVLADPNFGPNSPLYAAMGYTRKSERKSGLTRKKGGSTPPPAPPK